MHVDCKCKSDDAVTFKLIFRPRCAGVLRQRSRQLSGYFIILSLFVIMYRVNSQQNKLCVHFTLYIPIRVGRGNADYAMRGREIVRVSCRVATLHSYFCLYLYHYFSLSYTHSYPLVYIQKIGQDRIEVLYDARDFVYMSLLFFTVSYNSKNIISQSTHISSYITLLTLTLTLGLLACSRFTQVSLYTHMYHFIGVYM